MMAWSCHGSKPMDLEVAILIWITGNVETTVRLRGRTSEHAPAPQLLIENIPMCNPQNQHGDPARQCVVLHYPILTNTMVVFQCV